MEAINYFKREQHLKYQIINKYNGNNSGELQVPIFFYVVIEGPFVTD